MKMLPFYLFDFSSSYRKIQTPPLSLVYYKATPSASLDTQQQKHSHTHTHTLEFACVCVRGKRKKNPEITEGKEMRATNRYENGKSKNQRKMAKWKKKKKTTRTPNGEIIK